MSVLAMCHLRIGRSSGLRAESTMAPIRRSVRLGHSSNNVLSVSNPEVMPYVLSDKGLLRTALVLIIQRDGVGPNGRIDHSVHKFLRVIRIDATPKRLGKRQCR